MARIGALAWSFSVSSTASPLAMAQAIVARFNDCAMPRPRHARLTPVI